MNNANEFFERVIRLEKMLREVAKDRQVPNSVDIEKLRVAADELERVAKIMFADNYAQITSRI